MLKRFFLCALLITVSFSLLSCGYVRIDTDKAEDFDSTFLEARGYCLSSIWKTETDPSNNTEYLSPDYPEMLPQVSENAKVVSFFAKCVQELPVGNSVQILVSVQFERNAEYLSEKDRISNIVKENKVLITNDLFPDTAIVSSASIMSVCEYVVCEDEQLTLTYVFLQSVKTDDVEFDHKYLPKGYLDYSKIDNLSFTIYDLANDVVE